MPTYNTLPHDYRRKLHPVSDIIIERKTKNHRAQYEKNYKKKLMKITWLPMRKRVMSNWRETEREKRTIFYIWFKRQSHLFIGHYMEVENSLFFFFVFCLPGLS